MRNLHPPNRKNKERTKKIAVERFEGEVDKIVKNILTREYDYIFSSKQSRENYAKRIGKVLFNSQWKEYWVFQRNCD